MAEWRDAQLSDLIDIKHGFAFKGEFFTDEPTGEILATPGNFAIGGGFQLNKPKFYNGPVPKEYVLNPGDVIVTMTDLSKQADTLGYSAVVPAMKRRLLHNQRIGKVIAKDASANLSFIAWLMRTRPYRREIVGGATGSTVKHTSPGRILAHRFKLPSPKEQQDIVDVLQPLEDKIELNKRMNETLEGMAQSLFRDWFVDFGPTHRKAAGKTDPVAIMGGLTLNPARASELADLFPATFGADGLPVGWTAGTLDDLAHAASETVNPAVISSETPYFGLEHLPRQCITLDEWGNAGSVSSNKTRFSRGQVLFGKLRPYFHKVGIAPIDGVSSTDIVVLDSRRAADRPFVVSCVSTESFIAFTDQSSTGTKMPRTSWSLMKTYPVAIAPEPVRDGYTGIVQPMHDKIVAAVHENRTLAETRDYLLPQLMSGRVRIARKLEAA